MFRPVLQCARSAARSAAPSIVRSAAPNAFVRTQFPAFAVRTYASAGGMSKSEVEGRIMDLLKGFDKVCPLQDSIGLLVETNLLQ